MPSTSVPPGTRLFVGSLLYSVSKSDIRTFFTTAGAVADVYLAMDRERTGSRNRGFAFVQMEKPEDAEKAIRLFHNKPGPGGRKIVVRPANVGDPK